jgi:hypothetical protein
VPRGPNVLTRLRSAHGAVRTSVRVVPGARRPTECSAADSTCACAPGIAATAPVTSWAGRPAGDGLPERNCRSRRRTFAWDQLTVVVRARLGMGRMRDSCRTEIVLQGMIRAPGSPPAMCPQRSPANSESDYFVAWHAAALTKGYGGNPPSGRSVTPPTDRPVFCARTVCPDRCRMKGPPLSPGWPRCWCSRCPRRRCRSPSARRRSAPGRRARPRSPPAASRSTRRSGPTSYGCRAGPS